MLFCLIFAFIALSVSFLRLKKDFYLNALYLKLYGIIALIVVSILFISKFTNYQFIFSEDYELYLKLQRIHIHPYIIRNIQTVCHTLYLSSAIVFLGRRYKISAFRKFLFSIPLVLFVILNLSQVTNEISLQIYLMKFGNPENAFFIVNTLVSNVSYLIICFYTIIPLVLISKEIIKTSNLIKKNYFVSYLVCMMLSDILYFMIFIHGMFSGISPHQLGLNNIPSNIPMSGNMITSTIFLTTFSVIITIVIIFLKPFKAKKLDVEYVSTKHFQKFQYDNYYTTLHMLKNTLLCVYKYIEISEKHIDNTKALTSLECAKEQINEQLENYNSIMSHFKTKKLRFESINIIDVVNKSIDAEVEDTVVIYKDYNHEMDIRIMGDSNSINQVCRNIIDNALNSLMISTKENKEIRISIIDDDDYVIINFANNGDCIPKSHQKFLFNLFFSTHANEFCSGIGLYYAKEIVTHHGGDIWFKSTPQQTTFTIALPKINQEELQK